MSLLDKIKKHGVSESLRIARQHAVDAANNAVFRLCKWCFPINPNRIVLESEGDLSDNAYAFYDELRRSGSLARYQVVWLVDHVAEARSKVGPHTRCCVKRPASFRPVRSYLLATCRWYLYDHCNMMASLKKRPGQTGLPLFETAESLAEFSDFLQKNNILLIFKLHHLQAELPVFRAVLPNITVIRDADLAAARSSRSAPPCPSST